MPSAHGQAVLDALEVDRTRSGIIWYAHSGVGWSFVPTTDLEVTAVYSGSPQISFWQGTNHVLATYDYAGPYSDPRAQGPSTNFQSIVPLHLSIGQTYFVSSQSSNFSSANVFYIYSRAEGRPEPRFTTSPYFEGVGSYLLSSDGQWSSTVQPGYDNSDYLFLGPNFQFRVVPEPSCAALLWLALGLWPLRGAIIRTRHT